MSSVVLAGSTSGSITVNAAAVAGSNTATIGAATGTHYPFTAGTAVASTSGTSIDFTSIPSWVKRITVLLSGVSTSGASQLQIQLGTGAGPTFTTSGYLSIVGNVVSSIAGAATYTSGLVFATNISASTSTRGSIIISNITSNTWVSQGVAYSRGDTAAMSSGDIALGAAITALRVTTINGTDTFDAGSINILYE
jgi:hypothetical protein